jgi:hypothetical protein
VGSYHAQKSPSSSSRWGGGDEPCTASIGAQRGRPNTGSEAARVGTTGHQLSAECLEHNLDAQTYLGRVMAFKAVDGRYIGEDWEDLFAGGSDITHRVVVSQDLVDACTTYIDFVRELVQVLDGQLFVELRLPIDHITGEGVWLLDDEILDGWENVPNGGVPPVEGATWHPASGSCDAAILVPGGLLITVDLKLGRHPVEAYEVLVPAGADVLTGEPTPPVLQPNTQLAMYNSAALRHFEVFDDFTQCKLIIVQPFLGRTSEYACTVEELNQTIETLRQRSIECDVAPTFRPSQDNCHFCRASGNCEAQTAMVLETALSGFENIDEAKPRTVRTNQLGSLYDKLGLVQDWCKAVGARVMEELCAGRPVVRNDGQSYKLVPGKAGARAWKDKDEAEKTLKSMRLRDDQMYESSLISPTTAESLAKVKKAKKGQEPVTPVIGTRQWTTLQKLITQRSGDESPVIVLSSDPRPALGTNAADGFDNVDDETEADDPFSA